MPRPLRFEYPGALYHVTARGVQQAAIFIDDHDRASLLANLASALRACDARAFAFCLMDNHYHFVLQTCQANLSNLMHRVNSVYSSAFNRRHGRHGHLFEGRFKALHVDRDAYLLEVCRYVELNPVRAGRVEQPGQWRWSSYRSNTGAIASPRWLATGELHGALMGVAPRDDAQGAAACRSYAQWVEDGRGKRLWKKPSLRGGRCLGDEAFGELLGQKPI
jgi:REP element-mobilizing transposase RayT